MTIQILSSTMGDNQIQRLPYNTSPFSGSVPSPNRQTAELLLANAALLTGVSQEENRKSEIQRRQSPTSSGIVSHLRASSSSHQDIEAVLRAKGQSFEPTLAQQIRSLSSQTYGNNVDMLIQKAARDVAAASLAAQSIVTPSLGMLPSGLFNSQPLNSMPVTRTLGGFSLAKHPFGQDPRFSRLASPGPSTALAKPAKRSPIVLFMECDEDSLSEYQCLIRQQIELFEADKEEAASSVQGRNKQIVEGQVGIRCRHCTVVPPRSRQKGCMYFPTKLDRIYQAAQNLSAFHLCTHCKHVPEDVRKKILVLRERKSPAGGGKRYWGEGVRCLGVYEDSTGLRFRKS